MLWPMEGGVFGERSLFVQRTYAVLCQIQVGFCRMEAVRINAHIVELLEAQQVVFH